MYNNNLIKLVNNLNLAVVALVLMMGLALAATSFGPQLVLAQTAALKSSTEAKRTLERLNPRDLVKFKTPKVRAAMQRSYDALKAIANNSSPERESRLMDDFNLALHDLKKINPAPAVSLEECSKEYERCVELAKLTGADPKLCRLGLDGCVYVVLWISWVNEPVQKF